MKAHNYLGDIVKQLCWIFDGVIIGGFARTLYSNCEDMKNVKDIDVVIPLDMWVKASKIIPKDAKLNCFGGLKFIDTNDTSVDCWVDDVARVVFDYRKPNYIYNPKFDSFLIQINSNR